MNEPGQNATPEQLRTVANVTARLYQIAVRRYEDTVEQLLTEAATGHTTVQRLIQIVATSAYNCDHWNPHLQTLYEQATRHYPDTPTQPKP